ncbi:MAG: DUF3501 family protein [Gammaproteobacteria bacterium]|nr:MAG: DUF3501 family protein [Gammaproteobacteria bacterium]
MMNKLNREDLYSLEEYSNVRPEFRAKVLEHKKARQIALGEHLTLYFEDHLTIQYQIQEMLRIERVFEAEGIEDELGAYNPLIPDGSNFKATMMLEYTDIDERRVALAKLIGIEDKIWVQVEGHDKCYAIADEDLERTAEEKTSSVHFLRFELDEAMVSAFKGGAQLNAGVDHENMTVAVNPVSADSQAALLQDLD